MTIFFNEAGVPMTFTRSGCWSKSKFGTTVEKHYLDPEFGEAEFDEGDGMLDADAHELLKSVFPQ